MVNYLLRLHSAHEREEWYTAPEPGIDGLCSFAKRCNVAMINPALVPLLVPCVNEYRWQRGATLADIGASSRDGILLWILSCLLPQQTVKAHGAPIGCDPPELPEAHPVQRQIVAPSGPALQNARDVSRVAQRARTDALLARSDHDAQNQRDMIRQICAAQSAPMLGTSEGHARYRELSERIWNVWSKEIPARLKQLHRARGSSCTIWWSANDIVFAERYQNSIDLRNYETRAPVNSPSQRYAEPVDRGCAPYMLPRMQVDFARFLDAAADFRTTAVTGPGEVANWVLGPAFDSLVKSYTADMTAWGIAAAPSPAWNPAPTAGIARPASANSSN